MSGITNALREDYDGRDHFVRFGTIEGQDEGEPVFIASATDTTRTTGRLC